MSADAEVCRAHHDPDCQHCDTEVDDLWADPRDLGVASPAQQIKAIIDWLCDEDNAPRLPAINSDIYWAHAETPGQNVATAVIEILTRRVELENVVEDMRELIARF